MDETNVEYRIVGKASESYNDRARYYQTREAYDRQKRRFPRSDFIHSERTVSEWTDVDTDD